MVIPLISMVGLITTQAELTNLATRFSVLLLLPVSSADGLSKYCCRQCIDSLVGTLRGKLLTREREQEQPTSVQVW